MVTSPHIPQIDTVPSKLLLLKLFEGEKTIEQIAADCGISVIDLANCVSQPDHLDCLRRLIHLHDTRVAALLSSGRAHAAARLADIAANDNGNETCRKACVELLRSSGSAPDAPNAAESTSRSPMQPPPAPTEAMILRVLGKLGSEDREPFEDDERQEN